MQPKQNYPNWIFIREQEIFKLIDELLIPYHINNEDDLIEISGTCSFNMTATRLHRLLYPNSLKYVGQQYSFDIQPFKNLANVIH